MVLSVVYPGEDSKETHHATADVIAVHGLDGDAIETWSNSQTGVFWLKDCLPTDVPDIRVLSFGYNAAAAFGRSTADVIDHAKDLLSSLVDKREEEEEEQRPIIFIAHSLGGIVVKQALFQARIEPRYSSISEKTAGIIFFGTPHRGSEKATYGKVLATVANTLTHQPSSRLLNALQTNSDTLMRLTSDFRFQLPRYQVVSFFEQRPMKAFSGLIVEKSSALLDVDQEEQIPVDANHQDMCKFDGRTNATYEKVYKRVRRMKKGKILAGETTFHNTHFRVPFLLSSVFTGRVEILNRLTSSLIMSPTSKSRMQKRFILYGLGGSGKTQVCLKFAQDNREKFWGIFWIDMSSAANAEKDFSQVARLLDIDDDLAATKNWLSNTPEKWVLIFDNADDPQLPLSQYFPAGDRGSILITSRNPECRSYATVGSERIEQMMPSDATLLLLKTIYGQVPSHNDMEVRASKVVALLGNLALAITQAGAYIRQCSCHLDEYCSIYKQRRSQLLNYHPVHSDADYQYTVYTTWEVSLDMIKSTESTAAKFAIQLLKLMCFFYHDRISKRIFDEIWNTDSSSYESFEKAYLLQGIYDDTEYQNLFQESTTILASFSLITMDVDELISLHPLVHDWARDQMTQTERESIHRQTSSILASSVSWGFQSDDYLWRKSLLPHVDTCLRLRAGVMRDWIFEETDEMEAFALIYSENGHPVEALQLTEQVVKLRKRQLGEEHPDTLASMNNLTIEYSEAGRRQEALQLTQHVVELRKRQLGEEHPDTLSSMNNLATRYSEAGRRQEALQLTQHVVELQKRQLGEEHPDTLTSTNSLANRYSESGRRQEALRLAGQVVELYKRRLGEEHPDTLTSMNNLATRYSDVGRRKDALQLIQHVVELRKRRLGEEHPDTLTSMNNLANRYSEAGRRQEALQLTERVVEFRKRRLGEEHPDTLSSVNNLATRYGESGRRQEALQLTEHVVELRKRQLGEEHPNTLGSMSNLAIEYSEAGRRQEALQLTERVVELRKRQLGKEHPYTLTSMNSLAFEYSEAGRRQEALQLTQHVVELQKRQLGEEHPDTLTSMNDLATRYSEAGRRQEALQLTEQVVKLQKRQLGEEHPDTLTSMNNLATQYGEAGRQQEALRLAEQVVELRKGQLGDEHPDTLDSIEMLQLLRHR